MTKPIAVLISDIHFTVNTLELASISLTEARNKAFKLKVPLIICGDTLDSKAIIRAECANRLLEILQYKPYNHVETYVLVGNHDLINEKGSEHSLNFLKHCCTIVDNLTYIKELSLILLPYFSDKELLKEILSKLPKGITLIMHQGVQTANMGHYVQDKTSLEPEVFKDFRIISGHYHKAQDIKCGDIKNGYTGLFSYVGNPYTLSFSEANDGLKGYRILYSDGSLDLISLNLRKHIVIEREAKDALNSVSNYNPGDPVQMKLHGSSEELALIDKNKIGNKLFGHCNFKLDLIPYTNDLKQVNKENHSDSELLDELIDNTKESEDLKNHLKSLWREVLSGTFKSQNN